jgi:hypothetical protein
VLLLWERKAGARRVFMEPAGASDRRDSRGTLMNRAPRRRAIQPLQRNAIGPGFFAYRYRLDLNVTALLRLHSQKGGREGHGGIVDIKYLPLV